MNWPLDEPNPPDTMLPVWRDRYARGWPASDEGLATMTELWDLLSREYDTDAHHAAYQSPQPHRLTIEAAGRVPVSMALLVVDVDAHDRADQAQWRAAMRGVCADLPGDPFGFFTRGGARLLWRHEAKIASAPDAETWSAWYVRALLQIACATRFVVADPACRDWTRLYRVPHATREGERQAHGWVCGQPTRIGAWPGMPVPETMLRLEAKRLRATDDGWRKALTATWPDLMPEVVSTPAPHPKTPTRASGEGAIRHSVEKVRGAGKGQRNATLYAEARWLGTLVAKGELSRIDVEIALADAAKQAGLDAAEIKSALRSASKRSG
jgi:hypothetical protein